MSSLISELSEHPGFYFVYFQYRNPCTIIAGDLDAKAWLSRDGKPGISLNIDVKDWGYAAPAKAKDETTQPAGQ